MKLLFFLLLVVLIAQIGFWQTLAAVLGAVVMIGVLGTFFVALLAVGGLMVLGAFR